MQGCNGCSASVEIARVWKILTKATRAILTPAVECAEKARQKRLKDHGFRDGGDRVLPTRTCIARRPAPADHACASEQPAGRQRPASQALPLRAGDGGAVRQEPAIFLR